MKIIYPGDGGMAIIHPTGEVSLEEVIAKDVPKGVKYQIIEDDALPPDREFRNAWRMKGKKVTIDMPAAREVAREFIRVHRAPLLAKLDIDWMRNLPDAEQKRQALRDATTDARLDAATPEALSVACKAICDDATALAAR